MHNKPIVDCILIIPVEYLEIGGHALVQPSNHPNHLEGHQVSNKNPVHTSKIVSINNVDNMFETQNTIYQYTTM